MNIIANTSTNVIPTTETSGSKSSVVTYYNISDDEKINERITVKTPNAMRKRDKKHEEKMEMLLSEVENY